jgi:hypothetical protein
MQGFQRQQRFFQPQWTILPPLRRHKPQCGKDHRLFDFPIDDVQELTKANIHDNIIENIQILTAHSKNFPSNRKTSAPRRLWGLPQASGQRKQALRRLSYVRSCAHFSGTASSTAAPQFFSGKEEENYGRYRSIPGECVDAHRGQY